MYTATDSNFSFGHYKPGPLAGSLISLAQHGPHNALGRMTALGIRKLLTWYPGSPLDTEVEGIRLRCYLDDNVSERKFVFMPWLYDSREREYMCENLPANGTFIDIGANAGIYTIMASRVLDKDGTILALEPHPDMFQRLLFNLSINESQDHWPRVIALQCAVSDTDGELRLLLDPGNLGASSLVRGIPGQPGIPVRCRTLAGILDEYGVRQVDCLKIDIEGAEDMALCPFLAMAQDNQLPRSLIVENSERLWQRDLAGSLAGRGYSLVFRTRMNSVYSRRKG